MMNGVRFGSSFWSEASFIGVKLYHVLRTPLATGAILESADYKLRPHYELFRKPPTEQFLSIARFASDRRLEAAFESARLELAPTAPSRKTSLFAFFCMECAVWFRDKSRQGGAIVALLPRGDPRLFVGDLIWRNVAANILLKDVWQHADFPFHAETQEEALVATARAYWRGETAVNYTNESRPEVLIEGGAQITALTA